MPLRIRAHRADDILTVLRIAEEFDLDYTIEHCTERHRIADTLGENKDRATLGPAMLQSVRVVRAGVPKEKTFRFVTINAA